MPSASEDCLTINVFRPSNLGPEAKLPVVRPVNLSCLQYRLLTFVAILDVCISACPEDRHLTKNSYGGGFQDGASSMFNGSLIVDRSVARVCFSSDVPIHLSDNSLGNSPDLCQLQLSPWSSWFSTRPRRSVIAFSRVWED